VKALVLPDNLSCLAVEFAVFVFAGQGYKTKDKVIAGLDINQ
jgi:hypothetical protein